MAGVGDAVPCWRDGGSESTGSVGWRFAGMATDAGGRSSETRQMLPYTAQSPRQHPDSVRLRIVSEVFAAVVKAGPRWERGVPGGGGGMRM